MKHLVGIALVALGIGSHAIAEEEISPLRGTCHLTVLDAAGSVTVEKDVALAPLDPNMNFGSALRGNIEGFRVYVQIAAVRYDEIGKYESDRVFIHIRGGQSSASTSVSGRQLAAGTPGQVALQIPQKSLRCVVELK